MNIFQLHSTVDPTLEKPVFNVLFNSDYAREVCITMRAGHIIAEHKAASPIAVHVVNGDILFGLDNNEHHLQTGNIITVPANELHYLKANSDSIIRLTIFKVKQ